MSKNVWLNKKIGEAVKKRKSLGEETRLLVFQLILESEPGGMTTDELVKATGRDRRTIHGICREHQTKGLLNEKTSKNGKYHVSSNAIRIDNPFIGSLLVQYHMIRTQLFALGEVALSSSMDFFNPKYIRRILNNQKCLNNTEQKEALGKFYLFEFALRVGASILYIMIQSMKYANPSLKIGESMRNHLILNRFETAVNPMFFKGMFELLLSLLEARLWKDYDYPSIPFPPPPPEDENEKIQDATDKLLKEGDEETGSFRKKLMEERFGEMEQIYKDTFPIIFESIQNIGYDMVYEPGFVEVNRMEKEDPGHVKCGGELSETRVNQDGRITQRCLKCRRWIPVKKSRI